MPEMGVPCCFHVKNFPFDFFSAFSKKICMIL